MRPSDYAWFRRQLPIASIIVLVAALFAGGATRRVARFEYNVTSLIAFGCLRKPICFADANKSVMPVHPYAFLSGGYDGQFYYYIAASLYSDQSVKVDSIPFRYARIGYPLVTGWVYPFLGSGGLVWSMILIPFLFHLFTVASLFKKTKLYFPSLLYGVNPISLESFLLTVSDGVALDLAVLALLSSIASNDNAIQESPDSSKRRFFHTYLPAGLSCLLLSYSLLTKETMLAFPLAMIASFAVRVAGFYLLRRTGQWNAIRSNYIPAVIAFFSLIPLILWWHIVGFSPLNASRRGSIPFSGLMETIQQDGLHFSASSLLMVLIGAFSLILLRHIIRAYMKARKGEGGVSRDFKQQPNDIYFWTLLIDLCLVSFASAREYWANFANMVRLFTPGIFPAIYLVAKEKGVSSFPQFFFGSYLMLFTLLLLLKGG